MKKQAPLKERSGSVSPSDSPNDFRSWRLMLFNELLLQTVRGHRHGRGCGPGSGPLMGMGECVYIDMGSLIDFIVG